jgi:Flp pilus assembly pilin Flp
MAATDRADSLDPCLESGRCRLGAGDCLGARGVRRAAGTSFIEYALLCAIIVIGCASAVVTLQDSIKARLTSIANSLSAP